MENVWSISEYISWKTYSKNSDTKLQVIYLILRHRSNNDPIHALIALFLLSLSLSSLFLSQNISTDTIANSYIQHRLSPNFYFSFPFLTKCSKKNIYSRFHEKYKISRTKFRSTEQSNSNVDVGKRKKEKNHISRICAPKRCPSKIVHRAGKSRRNLEEIRRGEKGMAAHFFERTHVRIRAGPKPIVSRIADIVVVDQSMRWFQ